MYLANNEIPTNELRFKTKWVNDESTPQKHLQQKWLVRKNYASHYEWRDVDCVPSSAPDIEPYDENQNLCD